MTRSALIILGALALAACTAGLPPRTAYHPYPAPDQGPPPPAAHPSQEQRAPTGPRPVHSIGAGVLASSVAEGYMDNEESAMRSALRGSGIIVARTGNDLLLNIRSDELFGTSVALSDRGESLIERISDVVRKFDSTRIVIDGYTDTTGTHEENLAVSQKRAEAVAKRLANDGVEDKRLAAKGFGDEILRIPTGPNVNEPRNRRIEIRITPIVRT